MPDGFFYQEQWRLIERSVYFLKQFYDGSFTHMEFMTTEYPPDQTWIHGKMFNVRWPLIIGMEIGGDLIMYAARIPFIPIRSWVSILSLWQD